MIRTMAVLLALALAVFPRLAPAQAAASVEAVQMPAWFERGGARRPLAVGMELKGGDGVITGPGSRALVRLQEGSLVRLGEKASLHIAELAADRGGIFRLAMRVAAGAFRFTTDALAKLRRREVSIRVGTVTAGIRGTDLWGKSAAERQVVCLIEGAIDVGAEGEQPVRMDQARQFYRREKGRTQPIGFVEPAQLEQWARETDIAAGAGAARRGGEWQLALASTATQAAALELYDRLGEEGYAAEIRVRKTGDGLAYLVRIAHLPSKAEAEALGARLRGRPGLGEPRVSR